MKWRNRRQSSNIEDRRGRSAPMGGLGGKSIMGGGIGLILLLVFALLGGDLGSMLSPQITSPENIPYEASQEEEELADRGRRTVRHTGKTRRSYFTVGSFWNRMPMPFSSAQTISPRRDTSFCFFLRGMVREIF